MASARTCCTALAASVFSLGLSAETIAPTVIHDDPTSLLALSSPRFFEELTRLDLHAPANPEELWPLLDRCRAELEREAEAEPEEPKFQGAYGCVRVGEALARSSARDEQDRVLDHFETLSLENPLRDALLRGLLTGRLAEAVRDPAPNTAVAARRAPPPPLPDHLAEVSPDLQQAWQVMRALQLAYHNRLEEAQNAGALSIFEARADFQGSIVDFLKGRSSAAGTVSSVGRFVWGRTCGMGYDSLQAPQGLTVLLAFLASGDIDAAAGALVSSVGWVSSRDDLEGLDRELLGRLGFDWERVFLGRVLAGSAAGASALARAGSDRAARWLFEARTARPYGDETELGDHEAYLHALAALVPPTEHCSTVASWGSSLDLVRAPEAEPIGADLQAEILGLLESKVEPGTGQSEAETAARLLTRACRTESVPAFRKMARSPYSSVREAGSLALRALGEPAPAFRPNPPVVFTVSVDGAPFPEATIRWALALSSEGWFTSSSATSTEDGKLLLARDPFLDPKKVVDTVTLSTGDMKTPDSPWFSLRVPRPERLDRAVPVQVRTQSLTFVCPEAEPGTLKVGLEAPSALWSQGGLFLPILRDLPLGKEPLTFARLQRGRYRVRLEGPAGFWLSDPIALGPRPVTVTCGSLEPEGTVAANSAALIAR